MAFKSEEKKIGEYTFEVSTLPYSSAQKVLLKSKELLMLKVADTGQFEEGVSPLSAAVFMDLEEEKLEFVVEKMAEVSRVKTEGGSYLPLKSQKEIVFAGNMDVMFQWLDFALEVSFASFLGGLKSVASKQIAQAEAAVSKSRKK
jgi:hypothetical protein